MPSGTWSRRRFGHRLQSLPCAWCCLDHAAGARRLLLPSPAAGERLRGERGGAERVREEQRRCRRCRSRPGTVGAGGRAGAVGRDPASWHPRGAGGRAGRGRGDRPPGARPARLRCVLAAVPGAGRACPELEPQGRHGGSPVSPRSRSSPPAAGGLGHFSLSGWARNAGRRAAGAGGDSSDPEGTA